MKLFCDEMWRETVKTSNSIWIHFVWENENMESRELYSLAANIELLIIRRVWWMMLVALSCLLRNSQTTANWIVLWIEFTNLNIGTMTWHCSGSFLRNCGLARVVRTFKYPPQSTTALLCAIKSSEQKRDSSGSKRQLEDKSRRELKLMFYDDGECNSN